MLNNQAIVKVSMFNIKGGEQALDKNGNPAVILLPRYGQIPNTAQVVAGTVAIREGFVPGTVCLVNVVETEPSEVYGRQFSVSNDGTISTLDLATNASAFESAFGKGSVLTIEVEEEVVEEDKVNAAA